ncbi:hypothetical protein [Synechococcus phage BUCT-ZZ01]|nr:hypothetical protein [Synechococcus phage BUCT-ZZ01]
MVERKSVPQPRRKCLVEAKFRSGAGAHRKSNKALRRKEKMIIGVEALR